MATRKWINGGLGAKSSGDEQVDKLRFGGNFWRDQKVDKTVWGECFGFGVDWEYRSIFETKS